MALLDSHGIASFRVSGNPQALWPMALSPLGEIRIAVPAHVAEDARRIIESHREDVGTRVIRLRDEFDELQQRDRLPVQGSRTARARAHAPVARGRGRVGRRVRQRVARVSRRRGARARGRRGAVPAISGLRQRDRSRRSRPRSSPPSRWRGTPKRFDSASTCCSAAARRRREDASSRRSSPTRTRRSSRRSISMEACRRPRHSWSGSWGRRLPPARDQDVVGPDYKSALQERLQASGRALPEYRVAGALRARPPQALHDRSGCQRGNSRHRDRQGKEGGGAGSGEAGAGST